MLCTPDNKQQKWMILQLAGLQITVGHWTLAEQNLLMSDQTLTVVRHDFLTLFFKTKIFFSLVAYVVGPLFHPLKVAR